MLLGNGSGVKEGAIVGKEEGRRQGLMGWWIDGNWTGEFVHLVDIVHMFYGRFVLS